MADPPADLRPSISPSPDSEPFWRAAAEHRLVLPHCDACDSVFFYPRTLCPHCGSREVGWAPTAGLGTLYSFCVQHQCAVPGLREAVPFVTALVDLDEGPRLMSLLVGVPPDPDRLACGMRVEVTFQDLEEGRALPVFRPARSTEGDR